MYIEKSISISRDKTRNERPCVVSLLEARGQITIDMTAVHFESSQCLIIVFEVIKELDKTVGVEDAACTLTQG